MKLDSALAHNILNETYSQNSLWEAVGNDPFLLYGLYIKGWVPRHKKEWAIKAMIVSPTVALDLLSLEPDSDLRPNIIGAITASQPASLMALQWSGLTAQERAIFTDVVNEMTPNDMVNHLEVADNTIAKMLVDRLLGSTLDDGEICQLARVIVQGRMDTVLQARLIEWALSIPLAAQHILDLKGHRLLTAAQIERAIDTIGLTQTTARYAVRRFTHWLTPAQIDRLLDRVHGN